MKAKIRYLFILAFILLIVDKAACQTKSDTALSKMYNDMAWDWLDIDFDSTIYYSDKALNYALKSKHPIYLGDVYNLKCNIYRYKNEFQKAIEISKLAEEEFIKGNASQRKLVSVYLNRANVYHDLTNYVEAIQYYKKCIEISNRNSYPKVKLVASSNLISVYHNLNLYDEAIQYSELALKDAMKQNDSIQLGYILANTGSIFIAQEDFQKALELFKEAVKIFENKKLYYPKASSLSNVGLCQKALGKTENAYESYNTALIIYEDIGDSVAMATTISNLAGINSDFHNYKTAIQQALIANNIAKTYGLKEIYIKSSHILVDIFSKTRKIKEAKQYLIESYEIINDSLRDLDLLKSHFLSERTYYEEKNDFKMALRYTDSIILVSENIKKRDNNIKLTALQVKFDISKKEQEISNLNIKNNLQNSELSKKRTQQIALLVGLLILIVFSGFIYNRFKLTKKQNLIIEEQKSLIEIKHKEITDSINYAERIQRSFLATEELLFKNLTDYFVLFQPKDVVSGDFYWAGSLNNGNFAFLVADSTGHGVPGAIMSILNITAIESAILTENSPDRIFNQARKSIIERLKRDGSEEGGKDGMDASLIVINESKNKITFALANNPLWLLREGEIIEYKPDKMPVGKHDNDNVPFSLFEAELRKGDVIYMMTDGFQDQFGGEAGKKFKTKKLKELCLSIHTKTMEEQKEILYNELKNWKGDMEQVDDVCLAGIKI
ncbi:MAG: tetratricopeptide repeat protein [Bacteroidia bacterium]